MSAIVLPPSHVARWSATSSNETDAPPFEVGRKLSPRAGMDQAVLGQDGPRLEAVSGICLLIAIYVPPTKLGAIVHLWREDSLWHTQADLIHRVFNQYPAMTEATFAGFVSSLEVMQRHPVQLSEAKELISSLAPNAAITDLIVESSSHPNADPELVKRGFEMSVELYLGTWAAKLLIQDDYGTDQEIDLSN